MTERRDDDGAAGPEDPKRTPMTREESDSAIGRDVVIRQGGVTSVQAETVSVRQGGVVQLEAESVEMLQGGAVLAQTEQANLTASQAGLLYVRGDVNMEQAGAATLIAQGRVKMDQSGAVVMAANEVSADNSGVVFLLAKQVTGQVRSLFGPRESILFGVAAGAAAGLALLIGRKLSRG